MIVGIIRNGVYIRVNQERGAPIKDTQGDYFKGVKPSDLSRLDNRQLYESAVRLHESITGGVGTAEERAKANEAYNAVKHERMKRRSTIR